MMTMKMKMLLLPLLLLSMYSETLARSSLKAEMLDLANLDDAVAIAFQTQHSRSTNSSKCLAGGFFAAVEQVAVWLA